MLTALRIKNLALVADLALELQPGFNAISGETGAGKSIIIGALNLVLGERADRTLIRAGADSCTVEAVFDVTKLRAPLKAFLDENGLEPCEDHQLLLKRTFTASGANRQFVNGSPTTLAVLAQIGGWLVDMHGPHEHQSLLQPARQLAILDAFGGLEPLREKFTVLVRERAELTGQKAALIVDERTYAQQLDLLRHQVNEITAAKLQPDEEAAVTAEHSRASNAARLLQLCQTALGALSEDDASLLNQSGALGRQLHELQRLDPATAPLVEQHEQIGSLLRDLQGELSRYADKLDLDPARLLELEERLNVLHSLKRKYGATLTDVIAFGDDAKRRLQQLESRDAELERLNAALQKLDMALAQCGAELSTQRKKLIPKLNKAVTKHLGDLGFQRSEFTVALTTDTSLLTPHSSGFDTVEFQFAPNPGEPARPLRAIASSGEMARVMLAIKTVLAVEDEVPVLVFDEVDANIGGETAVAVGDKMRQIGREHQVLCITHLAPVAAAARTHYVVTKQVESGRTVSEIHPLEAKERVAELARMLGGQSAAALKHAGQLLADQK
jgi:DNA repair protein RecN (Recombination protein N)